MNRRSFNKLIGTAASSWVASPQSQAEPLPPTHDSAVGQAANELEQTYNRCVAACRPCDNLMPRPAQVTLLPGTSGAPLWLRFAVLNLAESTAEEISRLEKIVFGDWHVQKKGTPLDVEVRMTPRFEIPEMDNLPSPLVTESYELRIGAKAILTAKDYAGLQRGIQTLKQILENASQCGIMPHCRILDWPRIAHRGVHFDLAREMEYRPESMRKVVERLAYFKINMLHLYLENKFVYPSQPQVAPPGVMSPMQAGELCRYAKLFGVTIVPQIETLGHMEHFLLSDLVPLRERPDDPFNLCPSHPSARPFLAGLIADVAQAFGSPLIHVGYDESDSGGCERCRQRGSRAFVLAEHLNWLNQEVKQHGARTMIYGDKFLSPEEFPRSDAVNGGSIEEAHTALDRVDRDVIITDWHYTAPFGGSTRYLVNKGFTVYTVSATNIYWHDSIPLAQGHWWIAETLDRGIEAGAVGAFNSNWEYYRGQFFDNFWFFQALAAERQWSNSPHDFATYGQRFSSRFWGTETDFYSSLAALAEATATGRRIDFLDGHVLSIHPNRQMSFDYVERGRSFVERVQAFRREAVRNQDTLTLLDMPGQIIGYIGTRSYQIELLKRALVRGQKVQAVEALRQMQNVAREVAGRLAAGYELYGGAVEDRKRIQAHIDQLGQAVARIEGLESSDLKKVTIESLSTAK